ncbi:MAG: methylthioribulose 1-phosphate dehydratase [Bradymonadaceae bacterium]
MASTEQMAEQMARHARLFYRHGWMMGGSGNLSVRLDSGEVLVTVTGRHKGELGPEDFVRLGADVDLVDTEAPRPSSDTVLHQTIYRRCSGAGAVYHVHEPHAVAATTRFPEAEAFDFAGYRILNAFGITEIEESARVPVLVDGGKAGRLPDRLEAHFEDRPQTALPAFVADHHGLYVWGETTQRARCHVEALAHLFECKMLEEAAK